jgi:hypothetical protein
MSGKKRKTFHLEKTRFLPAIFFVERKNGAKKPVFVERKKRGKKARFLFR